MKFHDYIEKCPYCGKFFTSEQLYFHHCDPEIKEVKEIPILYHFETKNQKGETIIMAKGLNGILYRLRLNNPSIRRIFTDNKSDEDFTEPKRRLG